MFELPKVFVRPGEGRKAPLPVDGHLVPGLGKLVSRTMLVERLLANGDLVEAAPGAPAEVPVADAATDKKKG